MKCTVDAGCLNISGEISCQTINKENYRQFLQHFHAGLRHISFTEITHIDSACIALLVGAKRIMGTENPIIHAAPPALHNLLKLYELEQWITIA